MSGLQAELGLTVLYVTHDQAEALAMSTTVAVMNEGTIEQLATPRQIYDLPATRFVGSFVGRANFIAGTVKQTTDPHNGIAETPLGTVSFKSHDGVTGGDRVDILVRPEQLIFDPAATDSTSATAPIVESMAYQGDGIEYRLALDGTQLLARTEPHIVVEVGGRMGLTCKDGVYPAFPSEVS